jgi:hypothetical protein
MSGREYSRHTSFKDPEKALSEVYQGDDAAIEKGLKVFEDLEEALVSARGLLCVLAWSQKNSIKGELLVPRKRRNYGTLTLSQAKSSDGQSKKRSISALIACAYPTHNPGYGWHVVDSNLKIPLWERLTATDESSSTTLTELSSLSLDTDPTSVQTKLAASDALSIDKRLFDYKTKDLLPEFAKYIKPREAEN